MEKAKILSIINGFKKSWKSSMINILDVNQYWYSMGGYHVIIVNFKYRSKSYQLRHDIIDSFIIEN